MTNNIKSTFWQDDEIALLRRLYADADSAEIARKLGCSLSRVYCKASKLGLKKSADYMAHQIDRCRMMLASLGKENRFQPGLTPWNKGLKGVFHGTKETQFQTGTRNGNAAKLWKPVGSERTSRDGYLERKIDDTPGIKNSLKWKRVHKMLWESINGPVPDGHVVVFKNGDKTDIRIDNLELINRVQLMSRNTYHNYGKEVASLVQLRGAINRKINKMEGKK